LGALQQKRHIALDIRSATIPGEHALKSVHRETHHREEYK